MTLAAGSLDRFRRRVLEVTGLELPAQRLRDLDRAVHDRMASRGLQSAEKYLHLVEGERAEVEALAEFVTIGETYFFRHWDDFLVLRDQLLPPLIAREGRGGSPPLLWSAGCSSGEEPYSIAMVLRSVSPSSRGRVVGTDLSAARLEKARSAKYGEWSFRSVGTELLTGNFESAPGGLKRVAPAIQPMVEFLRYNLCADALPVSIAAGTVDVVFIRNVLIYFKPDAIRRVLARLHEALAPGGYLVIASAEVQFQNFGMFEWAPFKASAIFRKPPAGPRRVEAAPAAPSPPTPRSEPAPETRAELKVADVLVARARRERERGGEAHLRRAARLAAAASAKSPFEPAGPLLAALALLDVGDSAAALPMARRATHLAPEEPMACLALGYALSGSGDSSAAAIAFRNAQAAATKLPPEQLLAEGDGLSAGALLSALVQHAGGALPRLKELEPAGRAPRRRPPRA